MKTITFSDSQTLLIEDAMDRRIKAITLAINNLMDEDPNHPDLMKLRDQLDILRQVREMVRE